MMLRTRVWLLSGVALIAFFASTTGWATLVLPGSYQTEGTYGTDWTPSNAPALNDLGGGLYDFSMTGLTPNAAYFAKILDDEGSGAPDWGNPEIPAGAGNLWFFTDASGNVTLNLDRNSHGDGFSPDADRITFSTDLDAAASLLPGVFATGSWMDEAGGSGDWINNDAMFQMSDQGGGLYVKDVVISTPGWYEYKATGGNWDYQWGANAHNGNAANLWFETTMANEPVTFLLDVNQGAIAVSSVPEPATAVLLALSGLLALAACRRR